MNLVAHLLTKSIRRPDRYITPRNNHQEARSTVRLAVEVLETRDTTGNLAGGIVAAAFGGHPTAPLETLAMIVGNIGLLAAPSPLSTTSIDLNDTFNNALTDVLDSIQPVFINKLVRARACTFSNTRSFFFASRDLKTICLIRSATSGD